MKSEEIQDELKAAKWGFLTWFAEHGGKLHVDACGRVGPLGEPLRAAIRAYLLVRADELANQSPDDRIAEPGDLRALATKLAPAKEEG